ncbi:hypothetical protein CEXT_314751 [Caerostris extrusa]|uniref:MADF domain-containing protein n=1 Tax=Caerostris extrusa TaxID=172846 RepID=A0AAV4NRY7_CAEEX|nr:hypothetical protein CEXT_314751 [Caerostris extrusa]
MVLFFICFLARPSFKEPNRGEFRVIHKTIQSAGAQCNFKMLMTKILEKINSTWFSKTDKATGSDDLTETTDARNFCEPWPLEMNGLKKRTFDARVWTSAFEAVINCSQLRSSNDSSVNMQTIRKKWQNLTLF